MTLNFPFSHTRPSHSSSCIFLVSCDSNLNKNPPSMNQAYIARADPIDLALTKPNATPWTASRRSMHNIRCQFDWIMQQLHAQLLNSCHPPFNPNEQATNWFKKPLPPAWRSIWLTFAACRNQLDYDRFFSQLKSHRNSISLTLQPTESQVTRSQRIRFQNIHYIWDNKYIETTRVGKINNTSCLRLWRSCYTA